MIVCFCIDNFAHSDKFTIIGRNFDAKTIKRDWLWLQSLVINLVFWDFHQQLCGWQEFMSQCCRLCQILYVFLVKGSYLVFNSKYSLLVNISHDNLVFFLVFSVRFKIITLQYLFKIKIGTKQRSLGPNSQELRSRTNLMSFPTLWPKQLLLRRSPDSRLCVKPEPRNSTTLGCNLELDSARSMSWPCWFGT